MHKIKLIYEYSHTQKYYDQCGWDRLRIFPEKLDEECMDRANSPNRDPEPLKQERMNEWI